ncbi:MAG: hypothetical protein AAFQ14_02735 [Cyanobacteria bacterium J06621_12]
MDNKQLLAQTMACLLSTTPETTLGKLLNFCLAAKIEPENSGVILNFAENLLEHPEKLCQWISQAIDSDDDYSVDEMIAYTEMRIDNPDQFMDRLFEELDGVNIT